MTKDGSSISVALVGPGQQENLPLAYLAAALVRAGHSPLLVRYDNPGDESSCVEIIVKQRPELVGISIAFQYAVGDALVLIAALRRGGYDGHITCGGHVPTFCYEALLHDAPGLDSVVRHEGEQTLAELARKLARREPLSGLNGLVLRDGAELRVSAPRTVADIDGLAPPVRPGRLFQIGGVPVSFLLTSRGCVGECHYCSISAFTRSSGGPPYRLRSPEAVADEVAALYHERDARVFFVQDDLFVLPSEARTLSRIRGLTEALSARKVTEAMFWIKGRPESITPDVLSAAWTMGARHLFLGIEHADDQRLVYLGRRHRHEHNRRAIALAGQAGIRLSFNLMIFDPESTLEDVSGVMAFAGECVAMPWNICRTEIYPGTTLFGQLRDEGRLEGDYRTFGYTMRDRRAEILFRILRVSLHEHAFDVDSLLNKLISLSFARQIHERYFDDTESIGQSREVDRLVAEAHTDTVAEIREAVRFVETGDTASEVQVRRFAVEQAQRIGEADAGRFERFGQLWNQLSARGEFRFGRPRQVDRVQTA